MNHSLQCYWVRVPSSTSSINTDWLLTLWSWCFPENSSLTSQQWPSTAQWVWLEVPSSCFTLDCLFVRMTGSWFWTWFLGRNWCCLSQGFSDQSTGHLNQKVNNRSIGWSTNVKECLLKCADSWNVLIKCFLEISNPYKATLEVIFGRILRNFLRYSLLIEFESDWFPNKLSSSIFLFSRLWKNFLKTLKLE